MPDEMPISCRPDSRRPRYPLQQGVETQDPRYYLRGNSFSARFVLYYLSNERRQNTAVSFAAAWQGSSYSRALPSATPDQLKPLSARTRASGPEATATIWHSESAQAPGQSALAFLRSASCSTQSRSGWRAQVASDVVRAYYRLVESLPRRGTVGSKVGPGFLRTLQLV